MSEILPFSDEIETHHDRIDPNSCGDIYVVGDVHGSRAPLERLLDTLELDSDDRVIFTGDLVRKGPDSPGVIDTVRSDSRFMSVRGNNEQKIIRGDKFPEWLRPGDQSYFESLPVVISFDETLVVHGGIDPRRPLESHTMRELLNMRSPHGDGYSGPFWYDDHDGPYRVCFGHTVHQAPVNREHAVALDTGCVHGRILTAYDYRADEFVTINSETTHRERAASKIVSADPQR